MTRLLFVLVLVGCNLVEAEDVRPLEPVPEEYAGWHAEVEACLGRSRPFHRINFYVAATLVLDGVDVGGFYRAPRRITMREDHVYYPSSVKEELAHYVLRSGAHPPELLRCKAL